MTALVVHKDDGMVGVGYKEVLEIAGQPPLQGWRNANGTLPKRGSRVTRGSVRRSLRTGEGRRSPPGTRQPSNVGAAELRSHRRACAGCFVQLPATGVCDSCG